MGMTVIKEFAIVGGSSMIVTIVFHIMSMKEQKFYTCIETNLRPSFRIRRGFGNRHMDYAEDSDVTWSWILPAPNQSPVLH